MFRKPKKETELDHVISAALTRLEVLDPRTDEYATILERVSKLYKMKETEKPSRVSPDTWAMVGANLAGIILIIQHENLHPITSKALSFVHKVK